MSRLLRRSSDFREAWGDEEMTLGGGGVGFWPLLNRLTFLWWLEVRRWALLNKVRAALSLGVKNLVALRALFVHFHFVVLKVKKAGRATFTYLSVS